MPRPYQARELQFAIGTRDWQTVTTLVSSCLPKEISTDGLTDWLAEGIYSGDETPGQLATEWLQELRSGG